MNVWFIHSVWTFLLIVEYMLQNLQIQLQNFDQQQGQFRRSWSLFFVVWEFKHIEIEKQTNEQNEDRLVHNQETDEIKNYFLVACSSCFARSSILHK